MRGIIALGLIYLILFLTLSFVFIDYTDNAGNWVKGIIVVALVVLILMIPKGPDEGIVRGNLE